MKKSKFSDSQILAILKQHEAGVSVAELAREHGVSTALIYQWRSKPSALRCDNGPEYLSQTLVNWANQHQITLLYIQPGKPTQNAYIERFNRTARHEWLDMHQFESIAHAQLLATQWLWIYNSERPNTAIGGIPPRQLMTVA